MSGSILPFLKCEGVQCRHDMILKFLHLEFLHLQPLEHWLKRRQAPTVVRPAAALSGEQEDMLIRLVLAKELEVIVRRIETDNG